MDVNPYESPQASDASEGSTLRSRTKQGGFGNAIAVAVAQQAALLAVAALMLDGGRLLRGFSAAIAASWVVALIVIVCWRRPTALATGLVKYGFWFVIVLLLIAGAAASLATP